MESIFSPDNIASGLETNDYGIIVSREGTIAFLISVYNTIKQNSGGQVQILAGFDDEDGGLTAPHYDQ